jgi:hypothetical protein
VVHGNEEIFAEVEHWVHSIDKNSIVLSAPRTGLRRGYPLNVGLDYLREKSREFSFFCFLDDDDILYPMFSSRLVEVLDWTGADVAVGMSSKSYPGTSPEVSFDLLPPTALLATNFVPVHAYVVRTDFLVRSGVRLRETMHYLEDWDFLVALLAAGASFAQIPEFVSEFRIIGDGNRLQKEDPAHFFECRERVLARARAAAARLGINRFLADIATFNFADRPPLRPAEIRHLIDVRNMFLKEGDGLAR